MSNHTAKPALIIIILACLPCFAGDISADQGENRFRIAPDLIEVGAFYRGTEIEVNGEVPDCDDVVVKIQGENEEMKLNRKGKVAFFWLNVASIRVRNAPGIYIIASTRDLNEICSRELLDTLNLGYHALRNRLLFESDGTLTGREFNDFIMLKESCGTYHISTGVHLDSPAADGRRFSTFVKIPSVVPAGTYDVRLYCFRDGGLVLNDDAVLIIMEKGLPHFMRTLAFDHSAAYGMLAILIAITTGITIGIIFSGRKKRR